MEKIADRVRANLQKIQTKTLNIVTELKAKKLCYFKDELTDP